MIWVTLRAGRRRPAPTADEFGDRDRHRLDIALGDVELETAPARRAGHERAAPARTSDSARRVSRVDRSNRDLSSNA